MRSYFMIVMDAHKYETSSGILLWNAILFLALVSN
jgi:hypothetical protein